MLFSRTLFMNKRSHHFFSPSLTGPSERIKRGFGQWLLEPVTTITDVAERRQARLVSAILFALMLLLGMGSITAAHTLHNLLYARILSGMTFFLCIAYAISRTRHYRLAVPIQFAAYMAWPLLNIMLTGDYSAGNLLTILIFNIFTIILCSTFASLQATILLAAIYFLATLLLPVFIPAVPYVNLLVPLFFNAVGSVLIWVMTWHRNLMEKDRQLELSRVNEQLQEELAERKRAEEQLVYTALHDPLTDLPNRVLFMDRLHHALERAKRHKNFTFAVFFPDLDRFKVVNDSLGHNVGDLLLIESARRLTTCIRSEDTIARLGGDEFVILLEEVEVSADYLRVADRIQHDLALPCDLEGHRVFISVSMGIVQSAAGYERPEDILRDADIAMYRAKGQGRGRYEIFDPEMLERVMTRLELETDLRKALERQEFIVHYQPILDMGTRRIVGFEALVRWLHPTRGLIQPAEFIPTAEEVGLIIQIGDWVLEEACRQIRTWLVQFPADPPLTISVNLSAVQCAQADLVQKITEALRKNKLDARCLKLELTESVVVEDSASTSAMLSRLRELGVQVQIDDFGTGYSSLGYLHTLPVIDTLKIDRTFVSRLEMVDNGSDIVRTILALAHNLGMKVIAEGVETDGQLFKLKAMGCEYVQGFLFARPLDSEEAGTLLGKSFAGVDD